MPGPISQNENSYSNDASSPKISWFQISFKLVKPFEHKKRLRILQLPIPYCVSLIMVTITSHIFINIFQTVHFSTAKFTTGNKKNISFLLIPKSPKLCKKSEAIGPGTLNNFFFSLLTEMCKWNQWKKREDNKKETPFHFVFETEISCCNMSWMLAYQGKKERSNSAMWKDQTQQCFEKIFFKIYFL